MSFSPADTAISPGGSRCFVSKASKARQLGNVPFHPPAHGAARLQRCISSDKDVGQS
jgi:hypothetical protein